MSAPAPKPRRATYDDLCRVPDTMLAQIVDGELHVQPQPAIPHQQVASVLGMDLGGPFHRGRGGPGGWWILDEPELHLGEDVLVPDLAGWRRERLPELPREPAMTLAPDWLCEVLSPSSAVLDRVRKMPIYAAHHVEHVWLVDPMTRTLEVFRVEGAAWLRLCAYADTGMVRAPPFEAVELDLGALWPAPAGT